MLSEDLDFLKIKPLPKKNLEKNFFIEKKLEQELPAIIDKTSEKLINHLEFISKIQEKTGLINKDKIAKSIAEYKVEEQKKQSVKIKEEQSKLINNIIEEIFKTTELIIIKQFSKSKQDAVDKDLSKIVKKFDYIKEYNLDHKVDLEKKLGTTSYKDRLPEIPEKIIIKADNYYLNNRENFIEFIDRLFFNYKKELMKEEEDMKDGKISISCDTYSKKTGFSLLTHQKIVRDYINIYTPYRGILLYHGLGSGKTCSSIAIAEGLKNDKQIIVMTPASLLPNYIEELKKCGDYLYKKNQFWEFINTNLYSDEIKNISNILKLPEKYIRDNGGAWFVNINKSPNYEELSFEQQKEINNQINKMIEYKYMFLKYNGMREHILKSLSKDGKINPFSNKVVIIDEVHNFISRIVNKLKINKKNALSVKLYKYLMSAENCKIIFLSGTPIINYPYEIAILYNILRGYINTYIYKFDKSVSSDKVNNILKKEKLDIYIDNIEFKEQSKELMFTLNPFGYIKPSSNKNKVEYTSDQLNQDLFIDKFIHAFENNNITIKKENIVIKNYTVLPDSQEEFSSLFVSNSQLFNKNMFKMRIVGLTSYFRSAQEQLMPKYDDNINIVKVNMSDYQIGLYDEARIAERKGEKSTALIKEAQKMGMYEGDEEISGTYRIFSRAFCNFVFPDSIKRPMPSVDESVEEAVEKLETKELLGEEVLDSTMDVKTINDKLNNDDTVLEADDIKQLKKEDEELKDKSYTKRIEQALSELQKKGDEFLSLKGLQTYGPKYVALYNNIISEENKGIHLLYSQFKTLEGLGIFKLVLKQNNFIEFKVKKLSTGEYILDIKENDLLDLQHKQDGKQMFASHSGDETPEERDIIKNVLNNNWDLVPSKIVEKLKLIAKDNTMGEIIKLLMITSSGAEGISLKNVRFVHILEPYWHPVRIQQVIGRARRICSHNTLPVELQTVEVFLYLTEIQEDKIELLSIDTRIADGNETTDQFLYNLSLRKEKLNKDFLDNIKEASIDCNIHTRSSSKEKLNCFVIGNPSENNYMYTPNINKQSTDKELELNKKDVATQLFKIIGTNYGLDMKDNKVYDFDAFKQGKLVLLGKKNEDDNKIVFF